MARKKRNTVYRYFNVDGSTKNSTCLVNECGKILKTQHGANLLKHLKHMHPEQHKLATELNKTIPVQNENMIATKSVSDQVINECTNLVAIHGRPFSIIDDIAFQNLLKLIPNVMPVNAQKIRNNVQSMATELRYKIANTLQGKMLSLKVDIASIATRSFMGINCQYSEEGRIVLKNLAVTEIFQRHTSDHLKDILLLDLQRFRIDTQQIYCITTDNGANMIKMTKLINEARTDVIQQSASHETQAGPSTSLNIYLDYDDLDSDSDVDTEVEEREIENMTIKIQEELQTQFDNIAVRLDEESDYSIGIVRCAAHTLQLALQDASNNSNTRNLLLQCRELVRRLRTPQFVRTIRENNKMIPKLDCATRWHSAIDMVESLISLKEICTADERLNLPSTSWESLEDFAKSMTPAKVLTKKLQAEQLTVGDFYQEWMMCQYKLARINTEIAASIVSKMKEREKVLFENVSFINGIFLDPRVNSILTPHQQQKAKDNLIKLFFQHLILQKKHNPDSVVETVDTANESVDARSELEDFLNERYINRQSDLSVLLRRNDPRGEIINNLQQSFHLFLEEPLVKTTENVLLFWEKVRFKYPFLYTLSTIVHATPVTQVSVERLFSSLKFIVSNYRFSMRDNIIDDLLFLRGNNIFDNKN